MFLLSRIIATCAFSLMLFASKSSLAQIEVRPNNNVWIGDHAAWSHPTDRDLTVSGKGYFSCHPATSGIWFENRTYYNGVQVPMIEPQWGNTALLGDWDKKWWMTNTYYHKYEVAWHTSDSGNKMNIESLSGSESIQKIISLNPVSYNMKESYFDSIGPPDSVGHHISEEERNRTRKGFIAQDLQDVDPSLVKTSVNGDLMINEIGLIPTLANAMQKQQALIEQLQTQVDNLQQEVDCLKNNSNDCN